MTDLTAWLLAQIEDDEAEAREAVDIGHDWLVEDNSIGLWPDDREPPDGYMRFPRRAHARHATLWSPARVLAECAAKKAIVALGEKDSYWDDVLRLLAQPYRDRDGYRSEWDVR